jgi:PPOX class probable F420-dependent enzyme
MIPDNLIDILEAKGFANVATIGPHGEPQNNPVWYLWDGGTVNFSQTTSKQKIKNIQRDRRVALSILDPENPYRYIEIRGEVVSIEPDPDYAFINRLSNKYMGQDYPWLKEGEERLIVKVKPLHTTTM